MATNKYFSIVFQKKGMDKKAQTLDLLNKIPIRHPEKIAKRELIYKIDKSGFVHWKNVEKEVKELKLRIRQTVLQKISL